MRLVYPVRPELEHELLEKLRPFNRLLPEAELSNAAEVIHGLIRAVARHELIVEVHLGSDEEATRWKRIDKLKGVAKVLRQLAEAAGEIPLNELEWMKAWQELPADAVELLRSLGLRRDDHVAPTGFQVISPEAVLKILGRARQLASGGKRSREFQDRIAGQLWFILYEMSGKEAAEPSYEAGASDRAGHVSEFFKVINDHYRESLREPLVRINSGAAFQRIRKRVPRRRID